MSATPCPGGFPVTEDGSDYAAALIAFLTPPALAVFSPVEQVVTGDSTPADAAGLS
ncbi:hypothetical protein [Rathayibacter sp. AY1F3]|uniref:hypothetical protein n=1 Tax=Rathayibacter sp. AY1F3 TaxID=2080558 RepID=UPI0015E3C0D8|nr:hypothetical protein [Rathayibacter sp. AY1F3]